MARLMLVTETYPPEINGVARTLGRWTDAFSARGHDVRVVRPRRPGEPPGRDLVYGCGLPFYPQVRLGAVGPMRMYRLLLDDRPDLIHVATEGPLGFSTLVAAGRLGIPVASSFHTNFDHYAESYGVHVIKHAIFAYLAWFHNATRVTLVPSRATRDRLVAAGIRGVEIWSRGVEGDTFSPRHRDEALRASLGVVGGLLLLYVGRLAHEKNIPVLLSAYAALRESLPASVRDRTRLALVGDGPLAEGLRGLTPPGVVLAGELRGKELSRWYASADVFAFPSQSETFGNVVLEAQASGLAVVGFDSQGVNEQVTDGVTGLLVPPGGDFAAALRRVCDDADLRRTLSAAGRQRAERLDWKPIFDELEARYLAIIGDHYRGRKAA